MSVHGGAITVMSLLFLPTVNPATKQVATKAGAERSALAPSVCVMPAPPAPMVIPYPSTMTSVPRLMTIPTGKDSVAREVSGVKVTAATDAAGRRTISIQTSAGIAPGTYVLTADPVHWRDATIVKISGGTVAKDLSARSVAFASGLRFRRAAARPTACTPPPSTLTSPYVASFSPADRGGVGTEITFRGQNFSPDHFIAMVGDKPLTITSRSATEIRATLPPQAIRAPLIVGYCSDATNYVLSDSFAVLGEPKITAVMPTTFYRGDLVTVVGTDLEMAGHVNGPPLGGRSLPYVEILLHDTRTSLVANNTVQPFLEGKDMAWSSDGKKLTFRVDRVRTATVLNPQPSGLAGKLRLQHAGVYGSSEIYTVASPLPVTWAGVPPLTVTGFAPWTRLAQFGGNFMILGESTNHVTLEGQGMFEGLTTVSLAGKPLQASWNNGEYWDGHRVRVNVPLESSAGPFTVRRGSSSVESAPLLLDWVPKFMPETQTLLSSGLAIRMGQTYELRGWHLKATGVAGLTYTFSLTGMQQPFLALEILEHTESRIRFRVNSVGTVPSDPKVWAQYATKDWTRSLQMEATFNGVTKPLFEGGGFARYTLTQ